MGAHTALRLAVGNLNIHPSRYALPTVKVARLKLFLPKGQLAPEAPSKVSDKVEEENVLGPPPKHFKNPPEYSKKSPKYSRNPPKYSKKPPKYSRTSKIF